jgi:hypothetical protein
MHGLRDVGSMNSSTRRPVVEENVWIVKATGMASIVSGVYQIISFLLSRMKWAGYHVNLATVILPVCLI